MGELLCLSQRTSHSGLFSLSSPILPWASSLESPSLMWGQRPALRLPRPPWPRAQQRLGSGGPMAPSTRQQRGAGPEEEGRHGTPPTDGRPSSTHWKHGTVANP